MTPLNTGTLSTTPVAFCTEKKPSPVIAMLVATLEDEIVPWVVMVAWLGGDAAGDLLARDRGVRDEILEAGPDALVTGGG